MENSVLKIGLSGISKRSLTRKPKFKDANEFTRMVVQILTNLAHVQDTLGILAALKQPKLSPTGLCDALTFKK